MVCQSTWVVKQNDEMRRGHQYAKRMFAAWLACWTEEEIAEEENVNRDTVNELVSRPSAGLPALAGF